MTVAHSAFDSVSQALQHLGVGPEASDGPLKLYHLQGEISTCLIIFMALYDYQNVVGSRLSV